MSKTSRPSVLAVILLCASAIPGIMAQIASPGNIQSANAGNGNGNGNCHVSDFELPHDLLDATADANFPGPPKILAWSAALQLVGCMP